MLNSVSVVVPAYNASRFLHETLASVFAQTRLPHEVIVVDDVSTDGTPAIVRELATKAPVPLRLIELAKNTGGPATPMNVGIEAARGEYIALLDHDDLMLPEKLAMQAAVLDEQADLDIVMSDYESFSASGVLPATDARSRGGQWHERLTRGPGPVHRVDVADCLSAFLAPCGLQRGCSNMFFRKRLWARAGGFDPRTGTVADYDFVLRAIDRPVAWIDRKLFRRREHGANLSRPTHRNMLQGVISTSACLLRNDLPPPARAEFLSWAARVSASLRGSRHYIGALRVAAELARHGAWRLAARQCVLTFTYPFRAMPRKLRNSMKRRRVDGVLPGPADD